MVPALEAAESKQTSSCSQERGVKKEKTLLKRTLERTQETGHQNSYPRDIKAGSSASLFDSAGSCNLSC